MYGCKASVTFSLKTQNVAFLFKYGISSFLIYCFQRDHRRLRAGGGSSPDPEGGKQRHDSRGEGEDRPHPVLPVAAQNRCKSPEKGSSEGRRSGCWNSGFKSHFHTVSGGNFTIKYVKYLNTFILLTSLIKLCSKCLSDSLETDMNVKTFHTKWDALGHNQFKMCPLMTIKQRSVIGEVQ